MHVADCEVRVQRNIQMVGLYLRFTYLRFKYLNRRPVLVFTAKITHTSMKSQIQRKLHRSKDHNDHFGYNKKKYMRKRRFIKKHTDIFDAPTLDSLQDYRIPQLIVTGKVNETVMNMYLQRLRSHDLLTSLTHCQQRTKLLLGETRVAPVIELHEKGPLRRRQRVRVRGPSIQGRSGRRACGRRRSYGRWRRGYTRYLAHCNITEPDQHTNYTG